MQWRPASQAVPHTGVSHAKGRHTTPAPQAAFHVKGDGTPRTALAIRSTPTHSTQSTSAKWLHHAREQGTPLTACRTAYRGALGRSETNAGHAAGTRAAAGHATLTAGCAAAASIAGGHGPAEQPGEAAVGAGCSGQGGCWRSLSWSWPAWATRLRSSSSLRSSQRPRGSAAAAGVGVAAALEGCSV